MLHRGSWSTSSFGEELKIGRYTVRLKRSLGEGGFAFVHLVEDISNGRELVLKRASLQSKAGRAVYEKEVSVMRTLAHPNIVQIVTAVELPSSNSGVILMEYCPGGHLLDALNKLGGKLMDEVEVRSIFCDVVSAVKYLHDKGVTHRDIKLENVLRSASGPHKLCDFGSCLQGRVKLETAEQRANEEEVVEKTTTQMYRAPEMVDLYMQRELTEKVDVWALGCVLFALCYLKHPFRDAGNLGILSARIRIPENSRFSPGLNEVIQRMLTASPAHRPSALEVENCVHALSTGRPLPPPRSPRPTEPNEGAGASRSSPVGAASAAEIASNINDARLGGGERSREAGRRSHVTAEPKATTPSRTAGAKSKEPQLNPNSVAARRLASRKEAQGTELKQPAAPSAADHGLLSEPSPARERAISRENSDYSVSAEHNREYQELCRRALRQPAGAVRPPPAPGPGLREPVSRQSAGLSKDISPAGRRVSTGSGGFVGGAQTGNAGAVGWSSFAEFDQFASPAGAAPRFSDCFGPASFDTAAAAAAGGSEDPFAVEPNGCLDASGAGQDHRAAQRGSSGCGGFEAHNGGGMRDLERRNSIDHSPLLDLGSNSGERGGGDASVVALGERLTGGFPSTMASDGGSLYGGDAAWRRAEGLQLQRYPSTSPEKDRRSRPRASSSSAIYGGKALSGQSPGVILPCQQQRGVWIGGGGQGGQATQGPVVGSPAGPGCLDRQDYYRPATTSPAMNLGGIGGGGGQPWLAAEAKHEAATTAYGNMSIEDPGTIGGAFTRHGLGSSFPGATSAGSWPVRGRVANLSNDQSATGQRPPPPLPPGHGRVSSPRGGSSSPLRGNSGSSPPRTFSPTSKTPSSSPQDFLPTTGPPQRQEQHRQHAELQQQWILHGMPAPSGSSRITVQSHNGNVGWMGGPSVGAAKPVTWSAGMAAQSHPNRTGLQQGFQSGYPPPVIPAPLLTTPDSSLSSSTSWYTGSSGHDPFGVPPSFPPRRDGSR